MRLCHVLEEDYNALESVAVYLFGRMYEVYSELAKKYIGNQWLWGCEKRLVPKKRKTKSL